MGRHSPKIARKTQIIYLGPKFCVPFYLVKHQVKVFRCEAHISLLEMVISGWEATSIFESIWGGPSEIRLALRKMRDCALTFIVWLSLFFYVFLFLTPHLCYSLLLYFSLSFIPFLPCIPLTLQPPSFLSQTLFLPFPLNLPSSLAYLSWSPHSLPPFFSLFFCFTYVKKTR